MKHLKKIKYLLIFIFRFYTTALTADNHNLGEILELIQQDIKTLERAVYSETNKTNMDNDFNHVFMSCNAFIWRNRYF